MVLISTACGICATPDPYLFRGFQLGEFRLWRCRECGIGFITPKPTPEELTNYYGGAYRPPRRRPGEDRAAAAFVARLLQGAGLPSRTVLDFGAGWGALGRELQAQGYAVSGLEVAEEDRALANRNGIPTVRDLSELPSQAFGAVLARHVIEHLSDPLETLRQLRRVVQPGGVILIGVPNFGSVASRVLRGAWEWFAPPAHLWYFDRAGMAGLLVRAGFDPIRALSTQGDGAPLPLAVAAAPGRWMLRRRARPGYWRGTPADSGESSEHQARSALVAGYVSLMRLVKRAWPWGDEELWTAARVSR